MNETTNEKLCQIALTLTEGVGSVLLRQLISYCGSAEKVFSSTHDKLRKIPGIGQYIINNIKNKDLLIEAEKIIKIADKQAVNILFCTDSGYPNRLRNLYDAPSLLYYKGTANLNHKRCVGIVGTRQATNYGKEITDEIVIGLKQYEPLIISGLAYGIDIAAHQSAINNNVETVAVMASGLDIIYPKTHIKYANTMLENGAWVSENPFGRQPIRQSFLARNRIIAGLSDAIIVVESAKKGGAMVTAEYANNYNKEVFAVPGNLSSPSSEGTNYLIRNNKAAIYTDCNDIIESLLWDKTLNDEAISSAKLDLNHFTAEESQIISLLRQSTGLHIDELSWQSQISVNRVASILLTLEFQGIIRALPGKKFTLKN